MLDGHEVDPRGREEVEGVHVGASDDAKDILGPMVDKSLDKHLARGDQIVDSVQGRSPGKRGRISIF